MSWWPLRRVPGAATPTLGLSKRITWREMSHTWIDPLSDQVATSCLWMPSATCKETCNPDIQLLKDTRIYLKSVYCSFVLDHNCLQLRPITLFFIFILLLLLIPFCHNYKDRAVQTASMLTLVVLSLMMRGSQVGHLHYYNKVLPTRLCLCASHKVAGKRVIGTMLSCSEAHM